MSAQQRRASERGEVGLDPRCDDVTPLRLGIDAIQIAGFDPVPLYELVGVTRGRGGRLENSLRGDATETFREGETTDGSMLRTRIERETGGLAGGRQTE